MPSTTTYIKIVNEVLGAIGEPEVSAGNWASAVGPVAQVKRIVSRVHDSLENRLPDEHYQVAEEIKLYSPFAFAGGNDTTDYGVVDISGPTVTFTAATTLNLQYTALGATGATTCQNCMIQVDSSGSGLFGKEWDDSQWYRINAFPTAASLTLDQNHLSADAFVGPSAAIGTSWSGRIVQFRTPLPATFRDVQTMDHPFGSGFRCQRIALTEMRRRIAEYAPVYQSEHPRFYSIEYDNNLADDTSAGPFLHYFPFPSETRYYQLHFQRKRTKIDYDGAASSAVVDMPEDMVTELVYRATTRAKVDIQNDAPGAAVYRGLADEQSRDHMQKAMSSAETKPIQPDMTGYRGHARRRRVLGGTRLWVDE